jgi:hypothetical protein
MPRIRGGKWRDGDDNRRASTMENPTTETKKDRIREAPDFLYMD